MSRAIKIASTPLLLCMAACAFAWQPAGWVWHNWPYQYSLEKEGWYYLHEGQDLWGLNLASAGWSRLRDMEPGWLYFAWPYGYAASEPAWYWLNEANTLWCLSYVSSEWTRYGQASSVGGTYMVIDLSGGPAATTYPVNYLNAPPAGGWTDEYKTSKLVLRRIPKGSFMMGSPEGELGRSSDETLHQVTLAKDFYMGVFEVTQKQWERVMGNWPSWLTNAACRETRAVEAVSYYDLREQPNNTPIHPNWPQSGAVHAQSFVGRLRARTGLAGMDIPTEAQWEYACRAGTATALNSGCDLTNRFRDARLEEVGRCYYNGGSNFFVHTGLSLLLRYDGDTSVATAAVGGYQPNAFGLYDMHGNVSEWCLDWYGAYAAGPVVDPVGPAGGMYRVLRGGAWGGLSAATHRSAYRFDDYWAGNRDYYGGFRMAMTMPE